MLIFSFFSLYSNCRRFQIDSERRETEGSETEAVEDGVMMVMMIMMSRMRGRGEGKEMFRSLFLLDDDDDDDVRDGPRPDECRVLV